MPELIGGLDGGVMLITGDHGCDPTTPPTDHSRERTPSLAAGLEGGPHDIGTRDSFGDLGQTVAELLGADGSGLEGESFADPAPSGEVELMSTSRVQIGGRDRLILP